MNFKAVLRTREYSAQLRPLLRAYSSPAQRADRHWCARAEEESGPGALAPPDGSLPTLPCYPEPAQRQGSVARTAHAPAHAAAQNSPAQPRRAAPACPPGPPGLPARSPALARSSARSPADPPVRPCPTQAPACPPTGPLPGPVHPRSGTVFKHGPAGWSGWSVSPRRRRVGAASCVTRRPVTRVEEARDSEARAELGE
jgi:hypothetical protein